METSSGFSLKTEATIDTIPRPLALVSPEYYGKYKQAGIKTRWEQQSSLAPLPGLFSWGGWSHIEHRGKLLPMNDRWPAVGDVPPGTHHSFFWLGPIYQRSTLPVCPCGSLLVLHGHLETWPGWLCYEEMTHTEETTATRTEKLGWHGVLHVMEGVYYTTQILSVFIIFSTGGGAGSLSRRSLKGDISGCEQLGRGTCHQCFLPSLSDQGNALPLPWVWSAGVLNMAVLTSVVHIHSELYQLLTKSLGSSSGSHRSHQQGPSLLFVPFIFIFWATQIPVWMTIQFIVQVLSELCHFCWPSLMFNLTHPPTPKS